MNTIEEEKPSMKIGIDMADKMKLADIFEHEIVEKEGNAFLILKMPIDEEVLSLFKKGTRVRKTMSELSTIEKSDVRRGKMLMQMIVENDTNLKMNLAIRSEVQNKKNNG